MTQQAGNQVERTQQQANTTVTYTLIPGRLYLYHLIDYYISNVSKLYKSDAAPLEVKFNVSSSCVVVFSKQMRERETVYSLVS